MFIGIPHVLLLNFAQDGQKNPVTLCVTGMLALHATHRIGVNCSAGKGYRQAIDCKRYLVSQDSTGCIDLVAFSAADSESA